MPESQIFSASAYNFPVRTPAIMWTVAAALIPAGGAAFFVFGVGALVQLAAATAAAVFTEAACLALRKKSPAAVADGSAVVCGIIVGLSMPPLAPWWAGAFAAAAGISLAKHCYGGLGNNPFNPAMAGYALAYVSFPAEFAAWPDAAASPTPLLGAQLSAPAAAFLPWWLTAAPAAGGAVLLALRVIDWKLPAAFLLGVVVASLAFGEMSPAFHLRSGGLMLAAFFVITDPVTAAATPAGRWLYGALVGALIVWIRERGAHADGVAFAVLIGNMLAPLLDRAGRRRTLWKK